MSSRYVCGGFCRRTRSPHFDAALSNSRMHSNTATRTKLLLHTTIKISYRQPNMQHIPLELIDHIIDELYDDPTQAGRVALQSCILVSKYFRHRALKHVFKNVQITRNLDSARRMANLRQIIVSPPNSSFQGVGAYIESLRIHWQHITGPLDPDGRLEYKSIVAVLRKLHEEGNAVRHLRLSVQSFNTPSWTKIMPRFKKIFELLATSHHLVSLTIQNASSLPPFIVTGPSLKKLHLECRESPFLPKLMVPLAYPPLLEEIFIDHSYIFHHSPSAPRLSKLKKLVAFNRRPEDFPKIWNILCSAFDIVEYISILQRGKQTYHPLSLKDVNGL